MAVDSLERCAAQSRLPAELPFDFCFAGGQRPRYFEALMKSPSAHSRRLRRRSLCGAPCAHLSAAPARRYCASSKPTPKMPLDSRAFTSRLTRRSLSFCDYGDCRQMAGTRVFMPLAVAAQSWQVLGWRRPIRLMRLMPRRGAMRCDMIVRMLIADATSRDGRTALYTSDL